MSFDATIVAEKKLKGKGVAEVIQSGIFRILHITDYHGERTVCLDIDDVRTLYAFINKSYKGEGVYGISRNKTQRTTDVDRHDTNAGPRIRP